MSEHRRLMLLRDACARLLGWVPRRPEVIEVESSEEAVSNALRERVHAAEYARITHQEGVT